MFRSRAVLALVRRIKNTRFVPIVKKIDQNKNKSKFL
jgi:hypothetical protein